MSGPKVVRVVTREELVARCEGALARLDRCLQLWRQELAEMGRLSNASEKAADDRRQMLDAAMRADRFADVLAQAVAEVEFLAADVDAQRQNHVKAKAQEAGRRESARRTAREVAKLLAAAGVGEQLVPELSEVEKGQGSLAEADSVLARALAALSTKATAGLSESQTALARRLGSGATDESLQAWKAQYAQRDERLARVHQLVAEVRVLNERAPVVFEARLAELQLLDDGPARRLRVDSLELDLVAARSSLQRLARLRRDAELLRAEIAAEDWPEQVKSIEQLRSSSNDASQLESAISEAKVALEAFRKGRAAEARRLAVLGGLSSLGYSVAEGMSTALARSGRLVLQKPDMLGYGVELAGGESAERLQVRAVALAKSRDTTKDLAAESKWCSDFTDLRGALAAAGTQIVIEQALPVGKVPLRVVESDVDGLMQARRGSAGGQQRSVS